MNTLCTCGVCCTFIFANHPYPFQVPKHLTKYLFNRVYPLRVRAMNTSHEYEYTHAMFVYD